MKYIEAKNFIQNAASFGSVYGLESIKKMLERLNNPQNKLKFIHIAGTNGKGSTLAFLNAVLIDSGYVVGRYSSPALLDYREVIQVNEEYIGKEDLASLLTRIKEASDAMVSEGLAHPTKFEMEAALAFLYFVDKSCDIVLLETGLGGLLDATNIVSTTIISIISSISKDHMAILGDTLEEIAYQKAGIIKEGIDVVTLLQSKEIMGTLVQEATKKHASLYIADKNRRELVFSNYKKQVFNYTTLSNETYQGLEISLVGTHQLDNVMLALEAIARLRKLGFTISEEHVYSGLKRATWFGRFTLLSEKPIVIIDGAHNQDAAYRLRENLQLYFRDARKIFIIGMFKDKDYESMLALTCDLSEQIIVVDNKENERLFRAEDLKEIIYNYNPNVIASSSVEDAYDIALKQATKDDVIVCFGSLSFLGSIKKLTEKGENKNG